MPQITQQQQHQQHPQHHQIPGSGKGPSVSYYDRSAPSASNASLGSEIDDHIMLEDIHNIGFSLDSPSPDIDAGASINFGIWGGNGAGSGSVPRGSPSRS